MSSIIFNNAVSVKCLPWYANCQLVCSSATMKHAAESEKETTAPVFCWWCWDWILDDNTLSLNRPIQYFSTKEWSGWSWILPEKCHGFTINSWFGRQYAKGSACRLYIRRWHKIEQRLFSGHWSQCLASTSSDVKWAMSFRVVSVCGGSDISGSGAMPWSTMAKNARIISQIIIQNKRKLNKCDLHLGI